MAVNQFESTYNNSLEWLRWFLVTSLDFGQKLDFEQEFGEFLAISDNSTKLVLRYIMANK